MKIEELVGKIISSVERPELLVFDGHDRRDDNLRITFTDGTILELASWDYEGYSSGFDEQIISPTNFDGRVYTVGNEEQPDLIGKPKPLNNPQPTMNQIPNIEEVVEQFMMTWFRPAYFEALTPTNRQEQVIYDEAKLKWETCKQQLTETLHQQLQKARQDWLREEIVRLKSMFRYERSLSASMFNEAIQAFIDRYQAELDQDKQ